MDIPVHEKRVVVALLMVGDGSRKRAAGAVALNLDGASPGDGSKR